MNQPSNRPLADLAQELTDTMAPHGFRPVPEPASTIEGAAALLKRQTWNTNRAIVVVSLPAVPQAFDAYLRRLRKQVAYRCKFLPILYGIGIQAVIAAPGLASSGIDPAAHVAKIDNQWAIVQSVFLIDPEAQWFEAGKIWGQLVTGKFQNAILETLSRRFRSAPTR